MRILPFETFVFLTCHLQLSVENTKWVVTALQMTVTAIDLSGGRYNVVSQ